MTEALPDPGTRGGSRLTAVAAAAFLVTAVLLAIAYRTDDDAGLKEWLIVAGIDLVVTAIVFWLIVRRFLDRGGVPGIVLGVLALIALPVFWLGLSLILGAGAGLLGVETRERVREAKRGTAALVLGALAIVASIVAIVVG